MYMYIYIVDSISKIELLPLVFLHNLKFIVLELYVCDVYKINRLQYEYI